MGKKNNMKGACMLCLRDEVELTEHHLTPKEMGGTHLSTSMLCIPCHKHLHALYTNAELAVRLNTIEKLKEDPQIRKWLHYIKKQPATKVIRSSKSNDKRRKGKN
ncbi:hypothetical protein Q75_04380 [Bacillus coahuilensis p1.1.43]|uniref:HNH endonuclease 5 domain-containing protein n=1 Tax=Bacillus coahuilensis p1.1.43 TaxID=1150625 RepID=A0A147KAQ0_9BACI|nr:HNH endonuclease [Bacillus coahuilensis]KUP07742.1 hypothetical protein Q75_04380 [Bacillus coahuilensis p1.1.43]